ncbi:hypothetical protein D3C83_102970 [compost metagenome]
MPATADWLTEDCDTLAAPAAAAAAGATDAGPSTLSWNLLLVVFFLRCQAHAP